MPIRHLPVWVDGMTRRALGAQLSGPLVHDFVYLLTGGVFRQHFQIGWRRGRRMMVRPCRLRWVILGDSRQAECSGGNNDEQRGSDLQARRPRRFQFDSYCIHETRLA